MGQQNPHVRVEDVWATFEDRFPEWFKAYVRTSRMWFGYTRDVILQFYVIANIFDKFWL